VNRSPVTVVYNSSTSKVTSSEDKMPTFRRRDVLNASMSFHLPPVHIWCWFSILQTFKNSQFLSNNSFHASSVYARGHTTTHGPCSSWRPFHPI